MDYRILGKTGLKVSSMGFGGIPIQRIDAAGTRVLMEPESTTLTPHVHTARVNHSWAKHWKVSATSSSLPPRP